MLLELAELWLEPDELGLECEETLLPDDEPLLLGDEAELLLEDDGELWLEDDGELSLDEAELALESEELPLDALLLDMIAISSQCDRSRLAGLVADMSAG
jgi:hypothetical protein